MITVKEAQQTLWKVIEDSLVIIERISSAQQILNQLEFLQRDSTVWVRREPRTPNEGCAIARWSDNSHQCVLDVETQRIVAKCLSEITDYASIVGWNDNQPGLSKEDVILMLKHAYQLALEEKG